MALQSLAGQHVLISGASRGIGAACALAVAVHGARLTLTARTAPDLDAVAERCRAAGAAVTTVPLDVRDTTGLEQLAQAAGQVDILINNVGVLQLAPVQQLTLEQWDALFDVNLRSVYYLTHLLLPPMIAARRGQIVMINSTAAYGSRGYAGGACYAATKAALGAFSACLRHDLHPYNIRVSQIYPGYVDTAIFGDQRPPGIESYLQPEDVAIAVVQLLTLPAQIQLPEAPVISMAQDW